MLHQEILSRLSVITAEEERILHGQRDIDRELYMMDSRDIIRMEKLLSPGKMISIRPHTRFVHFPQHSHDYVEMVYMCAGETVHIVNGARLTLNAGELLLLGRNAAQEILPAGETDIAVNFIIRPEFFGAILPSLGKEDTPLKKFILDCLCGGEAENNYLYFKVADSIPVQNLMENLLWTMLSEVPNRREINQMTIGLLFSHLLTCTDRLSLGSSSQELIIRILEYIEDRYTDGSLSEISVLLHYDLSSLSRLIKRKTGRSFTELMQKKRLAQAAWMLRNTALKVDEIAVSVGYENISYFHKLFFKEFGCSPREYRCVK